MPWDPSIIQSFKQYTGPDPDQTARTLSQIALQGVQKQHTQASLASLLDAQEQERAVRGIYMANANTPANIPQALMGIGAGQEAATATKSYQDTLNAQFEHSARVLSGVQDSAGLVAAKQAMIQGGIPAQYVAQIPDDYAQAKPQIDAFVKFAIPAEKQAEMANKTENARIVAGMKTVTDGTGQQLQYEPDTGTYSKPVGKPKPPKPAADAGSTPGPDGSVGGMSAAAIDQAARRYIETGGELPAFGMNKQAGAIKVAILNKVTELAPDESIAGNKADFKSNMGSLAKAQAQFDAVDTFERTAIKNMDLAMKLVKKIPDAGSSLANKPLRALSSTMGSEDMAAFNTALKAARPEFGKILNGQVGSSGMSDGARVEMNHLMSDDLTVGQFLAASKVLLADTENRKSSAQGVLADIRKRVSKMKKTAPASEAGGGGGAKQVTAYRYNADHTQRKPMFSDGTEGPAEPVNGQ